VGDGIEPAIGYERDSIPRIRRYGIGSRMNSTMPWHTALKPFHSRRTIRFPNRKIKKTGIPISANFEFRQMNRRLDTVTTLAIKGLSLAVVLAPSLCSTAVSSAITIFHRVFCILRQKSLSSQYMKKPS
jgi:hypothetical protein